SLGSPSVIRNAGAKGSEWQLRPRGSRMDSKSSGSHPSGQRRSRRTLRPYEYFNGSEWWISAGARRNRSRACHPSTTSTGGRTASGSEEEPRATAPRCSPVPRPGTGAISIDRDRAGSRGGARAEVAGYLLARLGSLQDASESSALRVGLSSAAVHTTSCCSASLVSARVSQSRTSFPAIGWTRVLVPVERLATLRASHHRAN